MTTHHSPTLRQLLILIITTILIVLIGVEITARMLGYRPMSNAFIQDPQLGWRWTPGFQGLATAANNQLSYTLTITKQGLRDTAVYDNPKALDMTRILFLGDSVTAGQGVNIEDTFVSHIQTYIDENNLPYQAINGGIADYNTEQEALWLQNYGLEYEPDIIVLTYVLNDPRVFEAPPARTILITRIYNFLFLRSAAYNAYISLLVESRAKQSADEGRFRYIDEYWSLNWQEDPESLRDLVIQASDDWGLGWNTAAVEDNFKHLVQIDAIAREHNIQLIMMIMPVHVQVDAENVPDGLDLYLPQQLLKAQADRLSLPVIDPLESLVKHSNNDLFIDQVHLSKAGNEFISDVLINELFMLR